MPSSIDKEIQRHINEACALAEAQVEKMARDILRKHPNLEEFVCAMGSTFFTVKNGPRNNISTYERRYMKPLDNFLDRWDDMLRISDIPMKFTADGPKITKW